MLKGLVLTPPVVGRISIGKVVDKGGKRLPDRDDEFTITSQVQGRDGWILHPVDKQLRKEGEKLRSIPVSLLFSDPELNLRASYCMFDRKTGRPLCVGNGTTCKRSTVSGVQTLPCPAPEGCGLAQGGGCKPYGRLNVRIGDEDEFGTFIFRTTGFNSIRTLSTRLQYFRAASGGLLATLPLELRLRGKSTTMSHGTPIYYVDLTVRTGMSLAQAVAAARVASQEQAGAGIDQTQVDEAARQGFARGAFEESEEEGRSVVEEFYPPEEAVVPASRAPTGQRLAEKLSHKVSLSAGGADGRSA